MADKVNLNTASKEELEKVKSIGPERAERIIHWREEHGEFHSLDELKDVQGFADERIQEVKQYAMV